jgi:hypothetical protein
MCVTKIGLEEDTVGRPPMGARAMTAAEKQRRYRARKARIAGVKERREERKSKYAGFMLRADAALGFATYRKGPVDDDAVGMARAVAAAWAALAEQLAEQLTSGKTRKEVTRQSR